MIITQLKFPQIGGAPVFTVGDTTPFREGESSYSTIREEGSREEMVIGKNTVV
jgi:hypothetical protein